MVSTSPANGENFSSPVQIDKIVIVFNQKVSPETVFKRISLNRLIIENVDEESVAIKIIPDEDFKRYTIIPEQGFKYGQYRCTVGKGIENDEGADLKKDYVFYFSIGNDFIRPRITSIEFPYGRTTANNVAEVLVYFSESINLKNIFDEIKFSPSFNYNFSFDSISNVLRLSSIGYLSWGSYSLSIGKNIEDEFNNLLLNPTNIDFWIGTDTTIPQITGIFTNIGGINFMGTTAISNFGKGQSIYITFNKDIDKDSVKNSILFDPSVNFNTEVTSNIVRVYPVSFWAIEQMYVMKIKEGIKDVYGNASTNIIYKYVFVSNENTFYLRITNLVCCDETMNVWNPDVINKIRISGAETNSSTNIGIIVNFNSSLRPYTVLDKISINRITGSGVDKPEVLGLVFSNGNSTLLFNISGLLINDTSIYSLEFIGGSSGILDIHSNWIKGSYKYYFTVEAH